MKIKLKDGFFPLLPDDFRNKSEDREQGIRIESEINGVRYTLIGETIVVEDRTWGGLITVDLNKIKKFTDELTGILESFEY